ncbi:hypothetical protein [Micrococcus sp.]|uniref:hypothetical protein n=1 Tax=Micrococcus sp. TaxID=1271 RepID=UPI002A91C005|nr:hypothetical protein [Micrococcus sp.]MDY6054535.1 hypothetical protein [Micrococcus sp.]
MAKAAGLMLLFVMGAGVWLAAALATAVPILPLWLRGVTLVLGAAISVSVAMWATGSHKGRVWRRIVAPLVSSALFLFLVLALNRGWGRGLEDPSELWGPLVFSFILLVVGLTIFRGWVHAIILSPGLKNFLSFSAISFLVAVSASSGATLLWMMLSDLGVRRSDIPESGVAAAVLACFVGSVIVVVVAIFIAAGGWAMYFRVFAIRGFAADFVKFVNWLLLVFIGVIYVLGIASFVLSDTRQQLDKGSGLIFDISLAERRAACRAIENNDGVGVQAGEVVSLVRGDRGQIHWWKSSVATGGEKEPARGEFIPAQSMSVANAAFPVDGACGA